MKKILLYKYIMAFLVILLSGSFSYCYAQKTRYIEYHIVPLCKQDLSMANLEDLNFDFYLDGKLISEYSSNYPVGTHQLRIVTKPGNGFAGTRLIKDIRIVDTKYGDRTKTRNGQVYNINAEEANITLEIKESERDFDMSVFKLTIDRCHSGYTNANEAKVKVITTVTTVLGGYPTPVSNIYVQIGDQVVPIDKEGEGWLTIRPDQYKMTYYRNDKIFTSKSEPGTVTLRSTKMNNTQPLATTQRKNDESKLESNVPLLKENTGSGNLYDYELRINMIGSLGGVNEVRVVAVQPDVQVHRAGAPEDQWEELTKDMVLKQGDEISCDPDGAATLQFADGSTTVVKNTTQLKIASYFTEGGVVRTEIMLKMGEAAAKVNKSEATKSDFRIKTPTYDAGVSGTVFSVRYEPATMTSTVKVEEGKVVVTPVNKSFKPVTLIAGQQIQGDMTSQGNITPFTGKIDFSMPGKKILTDLNMEGNEPARSRGIQILTLSHEEGMGRAQKALEAEGYTIQDKGGDFVAGFKDIHTAVIACNATSDGRVYINIFVASISNDAGVPGAERVRLQKRMDQNYVSGNFIGEWSIKCCNDQLAWTLTITKQEGNAFSGVFSNAHGGGVLINGQLHGNTIEFDRSESIGGGWKQHWSAQLVNDGGKLRMINGVWTGSYLDLFPGRNNWHAEKK